MLVFEDEGKYWLVLISFVVIVGIISALYLNGLLILDLAPKEPTNLVGYQEEDHIILTWKDSISGDVEGYNIYRTRKPNELGDKINDKLIEQTVYKDKKVNQEGFYYYIVRAKDELNEEQNKNQINVFLDKTGPENCKISLNKNMTNKNKISTTIICKEAYWCRSKINDNNWSEYISYTSNKVWDLTKETEQMLYLQCKDKYNNIGTIISNKIIYDDVAPTISHNQLKETYFEGEILNLTFNINDNIENTINCLFEYENMSRKVTITEKQAIFNIQLDELDVGAKVFKVECNDSVGNTNLLEKVFNVVAKDEEIEEEYFNIEHGDDDTYSRKVNLYMNINDATKCRFKNENETWSTWTDYSNKYSNWKLSKDYGDKTVCMECYNVNESLGIKCDNILYEERDDSNNNNYDRLIFEINNDWPATNNEVVNLYYDEPTGKNIGACYVRNSNEESWVHYHICPDNGFQWRLENGKDGEREVLFKAVYENDEEIASDTINYDTQEPDEIDNLEGKAIQDGKIHLTWDELSDDIYQYVIYRREVDSGDPTKLMRLKRSLDREYRIVGHSQENEHVDSRNLENGHKYQYYVVAEDLAGNAGDADEIVSIVSDSYDPIVEITEPEEGRLFNERRIDVEFIATDDQSDELICELYLNNDLRSTIIVDSDDEEDYELRLTNDESQLLEIICKDGAENEGQDEVLISYEDNEPSPDPEPEPDETGEDDVDEPDPIA